MTPYELRFEIFKEAVKLSELEYQCKYNTAAMWNEANSVKMEYPEFPSYGHIEELAHRINNFVSSK